MAQFGILNVYKPSGITSRDVVDHVQRLTRPAKAGHAGTLDPLALGVLVICVGQATRLIRFVQGMRKHYRTTFILGQRSDTDDLEGQVFALPNAIEPTLAMIEDVIGRFIGEISQQPPAHSAIKVAGRRAYKLARKGTEFELASRSVTIHDIKISRYEYPELELDVECGSGTYIRALGRDIGAALNTGAVMSALERMAIGLFNREDAVALADLNTKTLPQYFQPALAGVDYLPRFTLTDGEIVEIRQVRWINAPSDLPDGSLSDDKPEWAAVDSAGQLIAILRKKHPGQLWPEINLG
jgi:tRNA pseudouridine55 synthase